MHFKHPEILNFLFLLIIPILVHLFQLRRFKKEYFTNVKILKELSVQTRKSSSIKKWLLLATRLLLLAALIVAFAQPFFLSKDNKNATNELYIILDNSFSMEAKGKNGELLKRAIQDLLQHTPEAQNFSLVTCSQNFWNTDIKSIQKELQNLPYSSNAFNLDQLLAQINARKTAFNKDIFVITDAIGIQQKQLKSFDKSSNINFVVPKSEQQNNVAVDSVFINQTLNDFYEIGVKLSAYGNDLKPTPIALYNQNKLVAKTIISFEGKTKIQNFTIPKADFQGNVSITDNSLNYDNDFYFTISKPQKTQVLVIGEIQKSEFLRRIYTENEFVFQTSELSQLDYNAIEKQDAIIINEITEIPQALQTTLKNFVLKGGNLVIIPSEKQNIASTNTFLKDFGNIQFRNIENTEKQITKIAFNHPLYANVFEKKADNFQYPNTKTSFLISSSNPAVLSYADQNSFLIAIQNPLSNVYVFAAALNKQNSNFQNAPLIVPTFFNMAQSIKKTGVTAIFIGNKTPFLVEGNLGKDEIAEIRGKDEKFVPIQQLLDKKIKLTFNDLPSFAGNYDIFNKENLLQNISFNYPRTESKIGVDNEDVLDDFKIQNSVESFFENLQTNRTDNQIWKWFAIFALIFLILEIFIQKFVK
jgi:hypothetical protein